MGKNNNSNYFDALLKPSATTSSRKVWSIDLETVWIPFFTAMNADGRAAVDNDALGYPLRLSYDKDGAVRFSKSGKPVVKVAKELSNQVRIVRENFTASLVVETERVIEVRPKEYAQQVELNAKLGKPIREKEDKDLARANEERLTLELEALETAQEPAGDTAPTLEKEAVLA